MCCISRTDLQCPIDIRNSIGITINEGVDGNLLLVAQLPDEAPSRSGGDACHADKDAIRTFPELVALKSLEDTTSLYRKNKLCIGLETQVFDR